MDDIQIAAATKYRLNIEDLPSPEQRKECPAFAGKLCRDLYYFNVETTLGSEELDEKEVDGEPLHGDELGTRTDESFLVWRYHTSDGCRY